MLKGVVFILVVTAIVSALVFACTPQAKAGTEARFKTIAYQDLGAGQNARLFQDTKTETCFLSYNLYGGYGVGTSVIEVNKGLCN